MVAIGMRVLSVPPQWVKRVALSLIVALVVAGIAILTTRYFPAGTALGDQVGYIQTVGTYVAILIATALGLYAIDQVHLARVAIDNDRTAREEDQRDQKRRILLAIRQELVYNRYVALQYEGRVVIKPELGESLVLSFRTEVFNAASRGPLWGMHPQTPVDELIVGVYQKISSLSIALDPHSPVRPMAISAVVAAFPALGLEALLPPFRRMEASLTQRMQLAYTLFLCATAMQWLVPWIGRRRAAIKGGRVRAVREAIERTIVAIQTEQDEVTPIDWYAIDTGIATEGVIILPQQALESKIARFIRWLGI